MFFQKKETWEVHDCMSGVVSNKNQMPTKKQNGCLEDSAPANDLQETFFGGGLAHRAKVLPVLLIIISHTSPQVL